MCCAIQLVAGFNTARSLLGVVRPRRAAPPRVCRPWTRRRASALLRHRSRACRPPGTDSADTGQPRESTVQTLRSAVMRRVAAGGKLECVFPWKLVPSITERRGAVAVASASPRGRLLLPFRVRLARGTGTGPRGGRIHAPPPTVLPAPGACLARGTGFRIAIDLVNRPCKLCVLLL